jgi:hypothetical protein
MQCAANGDTARIAKELAQAGEYGGFAVKVLDEQGNEVAYVPIGKRSN